MLKLKKKEQNLRNPTHLLSYKFLFGRFWWYSKNISFIKILKKEKNDHCLIWCGKVLQTPGHDVLMISGLLLFQDFLGDSQ